MHFLGQVLLKTKNTRQEEKEENMVLAITELWSHGKGKNVDNYRTQRAQNEKSLSISCKINQDQ